MTRTPTAVLLRSLLAYLLTFGLPTLTHAATLNVPSAAYPTIQAAINAASDSDTVLVADGTYSGPGNRDIDFNGKSLTVTSQYGPANTIVDCGGYKTTDGSGNHRGFYIHSGEETATISGFTVKNGYETYASGSSGYGGGIYSENHDGGGDTIALTNCTISENTASYGGGIYNGNYAGDGDTITLTNCTISGNTAFEGGGGVYNNNTYNGSNGTITLINCIVSGNTAPTGGGVYTYSNGNSMTTLANCDILKNTSVSGGGIADVTDGGITTLTKCTISGNTSSTSPGGGVSNTIYGGTIALDNCAITGNSAYTGGGIDNYVSEANVNGVFTLTNSTIAGNTATHGSGGGLSSYNGSDSVIALGNNIIHSDMGGEILNSKGAAPLVSYSDIQGGYPGTGNIDANPLFVNAAYSDLHLKRGSPCIGAGTVTNAPATDKDGNLRRNPPSMGAYEGAGAGSVVQRPAGSLTLYDAGYDFAHTDLSDSAVGPVDVPRLASDTQICTGAVADGATKVLLRYNASAAGTVAFTESGGVSGDSLRTINTTTQVIDGQNVAFALYTVPETLAPNEATRDVSFQAVWTPTGGAASAPVTMTLNLERTPVILIHGLWSSAGDTWNKNGGVKDALLAAGYVPSGPGQSLFLVDYSDTNVATLDANQAVLLLNRGGIREAQTVYHSRGVAITRVDVVGHSMGGLVTRKFAAWSAYSTRKNFHKGYIRRMITIGTPHLGSPMGNYLSDLHSLPLVGPTVDVALYKAGKLYGPAIEDLHPGSGGLAALGTTNIPCYAEAGDYDIQHLSDLTSFYNVLLFFAYRLHIGNSPSLQQLDTALFLGQPNDGVVPIPSQEGGLPGDFFRIEGLTNHLQECGNGNIGSDVVRLVTGPVSVFSPSFAAPQAAARVAAPQLTAHDAPVVAPFVTITAPTPGQVFHPGDTLTVTLTPNAGTTLTQALVQAGASPQTVGSALLSAAPYTAAFPVPTGVLGTVPVTVTAKDNAGNVCTATVSVFVQTNANLASMTVTAGATAPSGAALLTSQGSTTPLTVNGTFSDTTQADITASALGTTYTSSDPTIATVSTEGVVTALANGTCAVTVTNGSITATKNVIVQLGTPVIVSTTPAESNPGQTVSLALIGSDFGGASQIRFYLNGVADLSITATAIQAGPQGTSLTAAITIAPGAAPGLRTIVVTTPGGQSDLQAAPDAAGFTVISPQNTHVLWDNINGAASIWNYSPADGSYTHQEYGPYDGYTAIAAADGGTDGKTRVLWNKTDGSISLWSLDNTAAQFANFEFGPYPGWTGKALSVAADNTTHVLWTNTDGTASVWNYSASSGSLTHREYGPFAGWTAKAIADGPDGKSRLLWTKADGTLSLWSFDNTAGTFTHFEYGPFAGWTAGSISVGLDNTTHVLWTNTSGAASVWNENLGSGSYTHQEYGPYAGWTANAISDGADGKQRVLWDNTDGRMSLWSLDNATGIFGQFTYGAFPGWTATGVSGF